MSVVKLFVKAVVEYVLSLSHTHTHTHVAFESILRIYECNSTFQQAKFLIPSTVVFFLFSFFAKRLEKKTGIPLIATGEKPGISRPIWTLLAI